MTMNQDAEGTPIQAPTGDKAIIEGQEQQYAFAQAAMPAKGDPSPNQHPGFDIDELRLRLAAAQAPLWSELVGSADFNWMSRRRLGPRSRASAVVHRFDHQPDSARCRCEYRDRHSCDAATGNLEDGIKRWRADDGNVEPFHSDADIEADARARLAFCVSALRRRGHSAADMYETPMIRWYIEHGIATVDLREAIPEAVPVGEQLHDRTDTVPQDRWLERSRPISRAQPRAWTPAPIDPADAAERTHLRLLKAERSVRSHQAALLAVDAALRRADFDTYEERYDMLAKRDDLWLLIEVKSVNEKNLRRQVITALGQLAFYEYDIHHDIPSGVEIVKLVAFDRPISDQYVSAVLERIGVVMSWVEGDSYRVGDRALADRIAGR